jgi:nucleoside 2-deoxyribosyltransferase
MTDPFVLDHGDNPHPRMLTEALELRADARRNVVGPARFRWEGGLQMMAAATGETPQAIEAWMDSHGITQIYLCGPINGCTDNEAVTWRTTIKDALGERACIDPMRRDYRGREDESVAEIVQGDKDDIKTADVVLANCWQPSVGTSMEIFYAHSLGKPVVAILPTNEPISPWYRQHVVEIVHSLQEALDALSRYSVRPQGT